MSFSRKRRNPQQGYMLLTLMLIVTLLAIASLGWIERVDFQLKRDREEELIHRGVQYSRAIRRYVRKFGYYPANIEALEKTNNVRYLRKRYKDPITGKDFKLLHQNDVQMSFNPAAASGLPPGAPGAPGAALNGNTQAPDGPGPASPPPNDQPTGDNPTQPTGDNPTNDGGGGPTPGPANGTPQNPSAASPNPNGIASGQNIGGLPIVGVASTSKDKTIREFNKKDRYNAWQFIYDPSADRGGLITTPNQGIQNATVPGATPVNQMGGQQNPGPSPATPPNTPQTPNMPPDQQ